MGHENCECAVCQSGVAAFFDSTEQNIREHGCSVVCVANEYCYTVGGAISSGLDIAMGFVHGVINHIQMIVNREQELIDAIKEGKILRASKDLLGLNADGILFPIPTEIADEYCGAGVSYYRNRRALKEPPVFAQIIFPDSTGLYPWEEGFDFLTQASPWSPETLKALVAEHGITPYVAPNRTLQ